MLVRLLRRFTEPHKSTIAALITLQVVQSTANLFLPNINGEIIDNGVAKGDIGYIWSAGGVMLGISFLQFAANISVVYLAARLTMSLGRDIRSAVFHKVGTFSARESGSFGASTLITRTTNDVQQVQTLSFMGAMMLVSAPIVAVGGFVMALREDPGMSWLLLVCIPLLIIAVGLILVRQIPQFRQMQPKIDKINQTLREQIAGIRVLRAFVREEHETKKFADANSDLTATAMRVGRLVAMLFPTVMLVFNASTVAVLWFGAHRVEDASLQVGGMIAFLSYLVQILMAVMMATFVSSMIPRASVCADRIGEVLDTETTVAPPKAPVSELASRGLLEVKGAGFAYPGADKAVLDDITFTVEAGETTAIIGSTGAGKTTLIGLIPRLFDVTAGSVSLDGVDVRQLAPAKVSELIGLVPQKPYLFSGTVRSNLYYGNPDASDAELWEALEIAQAKDFVSEMSEGLDAPISQGGTNVSGGQRQRLSIARALLRRPEIFLFDDSFSALDLTTDSKLRAALGPVTAEAATLIVAQRVSTIYRADQIIVLEDGSIIGKGSHGELLENCPTYAEIVASQMTEEETR